jgi:exopolyphosphatase/guanosine-5'-triphosphate,3'-diphosphate pyrophosphatase
VGPVRQKPSGKAKKKAKKKPKAEAQEAKPARKKASRKPSVAVEAAVEHSIEGSVLAAVDIGTNAVRLKLARVLPDGSFDSLHQERDPVRPGEGVFHSGLMQRPVADRLVATLKQYALICRRHHARVRCVATSAFREARNRDEIVARVKREAGLDVEVVSGTEEARLICLGALRGMPKESKQLLIDIGGGSTELARAEGEEPTALWSIPLGAVRLTERFDTSGKVTRDQLIAARRYALRIVAESVPPKTAPGRHAIGSSGTIRALVSFTARPGTAHVVREDLTRAVEELAQLGPAGRRKRMDASRAEIVVAGAVILEAIAHHLRLDAITAIDGGLKEGVLVDLVRRSHARRSDPLLTEAVRATGRRFGYDEARALRTGVLALKLFDDLERVHHLSPEARLLLEVAAVLHGIGVVVNRTRHHKHTQYLIANTDLPGLSDHERELASLVARFHRRAVPTASHPSLEKLSAVEVRLVRKLVTLLRVVDLGSNDDVMDVDATAKGEVVNVRLTMRRGAAAPDVEPEKALFFAVFHKRLDVTVGR